VASRNHGPFGLVRILSERVAGEAACRWRGGDKKHAMLVEHKRKLGLVAALSATVLLTMSAGEPATSDRSKRAGNEGGAGDLLMLDREGRVTGLCPLRHTGVEAEISGPLARVTVTQDFENTSSEKIEAVYTFPLPSQSAVDDMTMTVGDRVIKGTIKRREEAREIYERARRQG